ncbi:MAG: ABC transporter ATP-binding protein [Eubacteriales bacterium]|nr:ABC transporter ATP-binding protein [Eubacteriales bacterium]
MIEVQNVSLIIKNKKILSDINLSLQEGMIYGLVGKNGSGKTMLMRCICGFTRVTDGQILYRNKRIGKDIDYPEDAGIIIESPGFIGCYTGYRNLKLLASIRSKANRETIKNTMQKCGLDPRLKTPVGKYSMGMRQRLGLAQAIMEDQKVLILDEPMNGLDENGVKDIRELLLEQKKRGKVILISSHSKEDIEYLCDEVYKMNGGVLTKVG